MATVTGVTAQRADEIEAASVTGAKIQGRNLILTTHGGTQINVGAIIPELYTLHYIGEIYVTTKPENPSTYLGGGTWVRWGKGRVPVSLDEAQAEFDGVEEVGGVKSVTATTANMPLHNHGGNTSGESNDHSHAGYTYGGGGHEHNYLQNNGRGGIQAGGSATVGDNTYYTAGTTGGGGHEHSVQTYGISATHVHAITPEGGGQPMTNLQPYITCYMWKRTA